jgi:hypothetical protein
MTEIPVALTGTTLGAVIQVASTDLGDLGLVVDIELS